MERNRSAAIFSDRVDFGPRSIAQLGAIPAVIGDGASIVAWRRGAFGPTQALLSIDGDAAATITGAALYGFLGGSINEWRYIAPLNNGAAIPIAGAGVGFVQAINIPAGFDALTVVGTLSAGNVVQQYIPVEYIS